jgi:hypothetical protein
MNSMKKIAASLFFLCTVSVPACLAGNRALLVGVGAYPHIRPQLPGIDKDIQHMREVALKIGYKQDEIRILFDKDATLDNIRSGIKEWLNAAGPNDNTLFYYSGHGGQIPDQAPIDEADSLDEVLIPFDADLVQMSKPTDNPLKNALIDDEFDILLRSIHSKLTVILDSCFSGGALKGITNPRIVGKVAQNLPKMVPLSRRITGKSDSPGATMLYKSDSVGFRAILAAKENEPAGATSEGSILTNGIYKTVMEARGNPTLEDILAVCEKIAADKQHPMLGGKPELWAKGIYLEQAGAAPPPPPAPVTVSSAFHNLQEFVDGAPAHVDVEVNQTEQHVGDLLEVRFVAPDDGYVTIVNVAEDSEDPQVLFPNKFHTDNHVTKGQRVVVPASGEFKLRASIHGNGSQQRNLVIAVFSSKQFPIQNNDPQKVFASFRKSNTREYDVEAANGGLEFAAGDVITTIRK